MQDAVWTLLHERNTQGLMSCKFQVDTILALCFTMGLPHEMHGDNNHFRFKGKGSLIGNFSALHHFVLNLAMLQNCLYSFVVCEIINDSQSRSIRRYYLYRLLVTDNGILSSCEIQCLFG